jgi:hypothetical protein
MKNAKTAEQIGFGALIFSIVGLSISVSLMSLIYFLMTRVFSEFPQELIDLIRFVIIGLIIVIVLIVGVLVYKIKSKEKICPRCQNPLPKWRFPKDGREALLGGLTCPNCGTKLTWQLRERK